MKGVALFAALWIASAPLPAQSVSKQVEIFGQKIHYIEAGSGPNVLLLHGLGGDATNWEFTVPALASKYHVWAPDQIGFGASDKPMINYRVQTLVDFLEAFCQKVGIDKATLVGNSLGGWTAAEFTLEHPERVEKLVLVDSAGYSFANSPVKPTRAMLLALNPSTLAGAKQVLGLIFAHQSLVTDANARLLFQKHLTNNDGYTINAFIDSILREEDFLDNKIAAIKVPTLIVWGRDDHLVRLASGEQFARDIAGSQLKVFDGCGHVPQIECAAPFNAELGKFLETRSTSSR